MRRLPQLLLIVSLLAAILTTGLVPSSSARSVISSDTSTSWIGQTNSVTLTITPSSPNELLLVGVTYNVNYPSYLPSSPGLTFHLVRHVDSYAGSIGINVDYAVLPSANQKYSITVAYQNGVVNNLGIILAAFSGENYLNPIAQNVATKGQNSAPSQPITPLNGVDLIWAFTGSGSPTTQKAGQGFALDRQLLYFGSPADEYGFSSSLVSFGTTVAGAWTLIGVEIEAPMATGQTVPVNLSPSATTSAGSTLTVSANVVGLVFNSPTFAWSTAGCPDFINPGSVPSFPYVSTASGTTTNCVFDVSVSDFAGDTGSGQSATVTINPVTGQTVPVGVSPTTIAPAGSTLTVFANLGGLVFSSPTYTWTAAGCPDFANPGSVPSFFYVSTSSGTATNCVLGVSVSDSSGNNGTGNSPTVTITNSVTGQTVPVFVSPSATVFAGSTLTVSANLAGLVFLNPTYAWTATGCPDFVNPGSAPSLSYVSTAPGVTTNCVLSVSVSDTAGDTGSGQSATVTINPVTGQTVPVGVSPSTAATAGSTLTISANIVGMVLSNPTYAWTATGCPDFVNPGSVPSFSYASTTSGITPNCVFSVSMSDSFGNTGYGNSPTVSITTGKSSVVLDTSQVVFGQFGTKTIQITTRQPNELIFVGVGFNNNYQINTPTATGLTFTSFTSTAKSGGASLGAQSYYAIAATAQTYTISTGYSSGARNNLGIIVAAFYGISSTMPFDGPFAWATGSGVSSTPAVSLSPSLPGDAIWAFQVNENCVAQTSGSGFRTDQAIGCYESPADEYSTSVVLGSQSVTFGKAAQYWVMFAVAIQDPPVISTSAGGGAANSLIANLRLGASLPTQVRAYDIARSLIGRLEMVD